MLGVQTGSYGVEASGNDAAVVEDQKVAGAQDFGQIAKKIIVVASGGAIEDEHAAGTANRRWGLGNQLFGEVEIEVGYAHFMSNFVVQIVVNCVVERGATMVIYVVDFDAKKHATFLKLFFRIIPGLGEFDGAIECRLDRGQVWRNWARPGDGDAREGFGD